MYASPVSVDGSSVTVANCSVAVTNSSVTVTNASVTVTNSSVTVANSSVAVANSSVAVANSSVNFANTSENDTNTSENVTDSSVTVTNCSVTVTNCSVTVANCSVGYDFLYMKYNKDDGSYGWNNPSVIFYDSLNGNDKASSIKVKNSRIYIAGSSDSTQNGYYVAAYNQVQGYPQKDYDNVFVPSFSRNGAVNQNMKRAAVVELDSSGNTYLIAQSWNETEAYYAIRKYDQQGNVIHTIDPYEHLFGGSESDNSTSQLQTTEEITLLSNYPNPFNPSTVISYKLKVTNYTELRVYDISGRLVRNLFSGIQQPGEYAITFDATGLASGMYYAVLNAGGSVSRIRMAVVK